MYAYGDIRKLHLEITEKCQASCAMCARTDEEGAFNSYLKNSELSLKDCMDIFPPEFVKQLRHMYMCGNFGDAIFAKDALAVFEYFRDNNFKMLLCLNTNGGGKSASWWRELAHVLNPGRVVFAIDGLADTNHIYREGVNWDIVMKSAEAFISEGGAAHWHYLVFKHNEHQVDEARKLAAEMGFEKFVVKKSSRFKGDRKRYKHLEIPTNPEYVNDSVYFLDYVKKNFGTYDNYLNSVEIKCKSLEDNEIYVSADGHVVPCCWLGYDMRRPQMKTQNASQIMQISDYDLENLNAKSKTLKGVFDSGVFDRIQDSWSIDTVANGKLSMCASTCSVNHDFFKKQF